MHEFSENLNKYLDGLDKLGKLHDAGKTAEADQFSENELDQLWNQLDEVDIETLNAMEVPNG